MSLKVEEFGDGGLYLDLWKGQLVRAVPDGQGGVAAEVVIEAPPKDAPLRVVARIEGADFSFELTRTPSGQIEVRDEGGKNTAGDQKSPPAGAWV